MAFFQKVNDKVQNVIKRGDSGGTVKDLQNQLNNNGANIAVDGVFGAETEAAVKDYQTKNNLTVDGMVGPETSGVLNGALTGIMATAGYNKNTGSTGSAGNNGSAGSTGSTGNTGTAGSASGGAAAKPGNDASAAQKDFTYNDYKESPVVSQALATLQQQLAAKPGAYQSTWQGQINGIIDRIMNREDFSYDVNSDALYQQYKDQYSALGKLAMQDTMGQAAGLTGGYGSSYASTAGNQAYQSYLSQLNDVVPELYGMAREQYNQEGQEMYNQYGLLVDQENQDYGRYVDQYDQWASERNHLQGVYSDERSFDYGQYVDDRNFEYGKYSDDKSYAYSEHTQKQAYEQAKVEGNNEVALQHVAALSPEDLTEALKSYSYDEDNKGLATFLDDCVAAGRLSPEQADEYYERYRTGKNDKNVVDTTVPANKFHSGALGGGGAMNAIKN